MNSKYKRVNNRDYIALIDEKADTNCCAVKYIKSKSDHSNQIQIGMHDGGGRIEGVLIDNPEDVRWFAEELLALADKMEKNK